jgi:hypothetical protein
LLTALVGKNSFRIIIRWVEMHTKQRTENSDLLYLRKIYKNKKEKNVIIFFLSYLDFPLCIGMISCLLLFHYQPEPGKNLFA